MNVNASIVDHRVTGSVDSHPEWFADGADLNRQKSIAFVLLCMSSYFGIAPDSVSICLPKEAMMPVWTAFGSATSRMMSSWSPCSRGNIG